MKDKKRVIRLVAGAFVLLTGIHVFPFAASAETAGEWREENGKLFWYENGVKQGYNANDATYRGKEIFDPASNAWFWLDNVQGGARAVNKDVYQESEAGPWADNEDGTGKWVRYDENGYMIKGWQVTEDGTYYFDPIYGTMAKGDVEIDGIPCSFDEVTGVALTQQWKKMNDAKYWYENGVRQGYEPNNVTYRGKEIYDPASDAWYWLDNVDKGKMATGKDVYQESLAGDWGDYIDENGKKCGKWVRYDENGHMIKGWQTTEEGTYYFDLTYGTMAKGSATIGGKIYYFDKETGVLQDNHEDVDIKFDWGML